MVVSLREVGYHSGVGDVWGWKVEVLLAWQEAFPVLALLELHSHSSLKREYADGLEVR